MMVHQTNDHGYRRMSELNLAGFLARSAANGPVNLGCHLGAGVPDPCKAVFQPGVLVLFSGQQGFYRRDFRIACSQGYRRGHVLRKESPLHRQTHLHLWEKRCRKRGIRS